MTSEYHTRQSGLVQEEVLTGLNILIIGAGGVGSWTALGLLKMGSTMLSVIDKDVIEEANIGSQLYSPLDIGENKTEALAKRLEQFTKNTLTPIVGEWKPEHNKDMNIIISAVDSMETRKAIFESLIDTKTIFIDGRMAGNAINIFYSHMDNEIEVEGYKKTLFTDQEADSIPCSQRAVVYNTLIIAGLITDYVAHIANDKTAPKELIVDLANFAMYGGAL